MRALVRTPAGAESVEHTGAESIRGDVLDPEALTDGVAGCPLVIHVAGVNDACPRRPAHMYRVNIEGTRNVVRAAAGAGADRVVFTSSAATIGEAKGEIGSENTPHSGSYLTAYARSKHLGEMAGFEAGERLGVEVVAVNPSSVQGPGRVEGTARILVAYLQGRLKFAVETRLSTVFAADCADAHLLAAEKGVAGRRYLVSGPSVMVSEALERLAVVSGVLRRVYMLPKWLVLGAGAVIGPAFWLVRKEPPLCLGAARTITHGHTFDAGRSQEELGLAYTPFDDALRTTVEWYRSEGIV